MAVLKLQVLLFAAALINFSSAQTWNSLGCFTVDNVDRDIMTQVSAQNHQLTPETCQATCGDLGFTMAAVEKGNDCWCGNIFKTGSPSSGCIMPCNGDDSQVRFHNGDLDF
jgi:WSC domain